MAPTVAVPLTIAVLAIASIASGVTVSTGGVAGVASESLVGMTFDFWLKDDPRFGQKWGDAGILTVDLNNPNLLQLASALSPGILRIGGSPEDSITYGSFCNATTAPPALIPGEKSYYCSQVTPANYACLTNNRWDEVMEFAETTGLRLVLGLNACTGRTSPNTPMDLSMIEEFLTYVASSPHQYIYGFELGNELDQTINATVWAEDFNRLYDLIAKIWPSSSTRPLLMGPDTVFSESYLTQFSQGLRKGILSALSFHEYPNCLSTNTTVFPLQCLAQIDAFSQNASALSAKYGYDSWAGESAEHSGGGIANLTDTLASSFYYAYQLGTLSKYGLKVSGRQCLVGGDYGLIDKNTWLPNPDYWLAYTWRNLVGPVSLKVQYTPQENLAIFAGCGVKGGVVLVVINFSLLDGTTVTWSAGAQGSQTLQTYHITGPITGKAFIVNGSPIVYPNPQGLPDLSKLAKTESRTVAIAAASIVFMVDSSATCPQQQ